MVAMTLAPDDPRHGTDNGYSNLGCRCQPCRDAFNVRMLVYFQTHPEQRRKKRERERRRYRSQKDAT